MPEMKCTNNGVVGFSPIANEVSSLLILGTIPGHDSLVKHQYYANSRNAFWDIMGELVGASPKLSYEERLRTLVANGIAIWDVLEAGQRQGSSDSKIRDNAIEVNDFGSFLTSHPNIEHIFFNGAKAEELYRKHVLPELSLAHSAIGRQRLPSTSPANASMTFRRKFEEWHTILRFTNQIEDISWCT